MSRRRARRFGPRVASRTYWHWWRSAGGPPQPVTPISSSHRVDLRDTLALSERLSEALDYRVTLQDTAALQDLLATTLHVGGQMETVSLRDVLISSDRLSAEVIRHVQLQDMLVLDDRLSALLTKIVALRDDVSGSLTDTLTATLQTSETAALRDVLALLETLSVSVQYRVELSDDVTPALRDELDNVLRLEDSLIGVLDDRLVLRFTYRNDLRDALAPHDLLHTALETAQLFYVSLQDDLTPTDTLTTSTAFVYNTALRDTLYPTERMSTTLTSASGAVLHHNLQDTLRPTDTLTVSTAFVLSHSLRDDIRPALRDTLQTVLSQGHVYTAQLRDALNVLPEWEFGLQAVPPAADEIVRFVTIRASPAANTDTLFYDIEPDPFVGRRTFEYQGITGTLSRIRWFSSGDLLMNGRVPTGSALEFTGVINRGSNEFLWRPLFLTRSGHRFQLPESITTVIGNSFIRVRLGAAGSAFRALLNIPNEPILVVFGRPYDVYTRPRGIGERLTVNPAVPLGVYAHDALVGHTPLGATELWDPGLGSIQIFRRGSETWLYDTTQQQFRQFDLSAQTLAAPNALSGAGHTGLRGFVWHNNNNYYVNLVSSTFGRVDPTAPSTVEVADVEYEPIALASDGTTLYVMKNRTRVVSDINPTNGALSNSRRLDSGDHTPTAMHYFQGALFIAADDPSGGSLLLRWTIGTTGSVAYEVGTTSYTIESLTDDGTQLIGADNQGRIVGFTLPAAPPVADYLSVQEEDRGELRERLQPTESLAISMSIQVSLQDTLTPTDHIAALDVQRPYHYALALQDDVAADDTLTTTAVSTHTLRDAVTLRDIPPHTGIVSGGPAPHHYTSGMREVLTTTDTLTVSVSETHSLRDVLTPTDRISHTLHRGIHYTQTVRDVLDIMDTLVVQFRRQRSLNHFTLNRVSLN